MRKTASAIRSYLKLKFSFNERMDRNEKKLLTIKRIEASPVHSSIKVTSLNLETFSEVSTIRQKPKRFDDVFKM